MDMTPEQAAEVCARHTRFTRDDWLPTIRDWHNAGLAVTDLIGWQERNEYRASPGLVADMIHAANDPTASAFDVRRIGQ